jgi:hypothetical protein
MCALVCCIHVEREASVVMQLPGGGLCDPVQPFRYTPATWQATQLTHTSFGNKCHPLLPHPPLTPTHLA